MFYFVVKRFTFLWWGLLYIILMNFNFRMIAFSLCWYFSLVLLVEDWRIVRLKLRSRIFVLGLGAVVKNIKVILKRIWNLLFLRLRMDPTLEKSLVFLKIIFKGLFVLQIFVETTFFKIAHFWGMESFIHLAQNIVVIFFPLILLILLLFFGNYCDFEVRLST
jgi:hypothetical protein